MLPTTKEMAMQIALMHELHPKDTVSKLAERLMYSPVFMINALDEGEQMELFSRIKEKDQIMAVTSLNYDTLQGSEFGQENFRIQNEILRVVIDANKDEADVETGTLDMWTIGIRPADIEIALHLLKNIGWLVEYTVKNPKDKDSNYRFLTLRINEGKEWGKKQLKSEKKK